MRPHYLAREPGLAIPFVALVLNVILLLFVGAQIRSVSGRLNLTMGETSKGSSPHITITQSGHMTLNGSVMSNAAELEYHLSGMSAGAKSISLDFPADLPSGRLSEILQVCNRAGFVDIALAAQSAGTNVPGRP